MDLEGAERGPQHPTQLPRSAWQLRRNGLLGCRQSAPQGTRSVDVQKQGRGLRCNKEGQVGSLSYILVTVHVPRLMSSSFRLSFQRVRADQVPCARWQDLVRHPHLCQPDRDQPRREPAYPSPSVGEGGSQGGPHQEERVRSVKSSPPCVMSNAGHVLTYALTFRVAEYAGLLGSACPAGVYEYIDSTDADAVDGKKFVINSQNCSQSLLHVVNNLSLPLLNLTFFSSVHCKTCSIKVRSSRFSACSVLPLSRCGGSLTELFSVPLSPAQVPTQDITWTVPEGGGGPKYGESRRSAPHAVCSPYLANTLLLLLPQPSHDHLLLRPFIAFDPRTRMSHPFALHFAFTHPHVPHVIVSLSRTVASVGVNPQPDHPSALPCS